MSIQTLYQQRKYGLHIKNKLFMVASLAVSLGMFAPVFANGVASAATGTCTAPATDYGTDTLSVNVPATGSYYVWTRMAADSTADNSYLLQVDSSNCFTVGNSSAKNVPVYASGATEHFANDSSNWIDTDTSASRVQVSLSAGTHSIKLIGNAPNLVVDRLIFTQDSTCTPSDVGQNCADTIKPTAAVTSPTSSQTVSGTINLIGHATDNIGIAKVEFYLDGESSSTTPIATVTSGSSGNYSTPFDTTTVADGDHAVAIIAYDAAGNSQGTSWVHFTVSNGTPASDTTPPTVGLSGLTSASILNNNSLGAPYNSSSYPVTVNASDASGIKSVVLKVDGVTNATDTTSPYKFTVNLSSLSCGAHTFQATATDNSTNNNTANTSASLKVTYQGDLNGSCGVDFSDVSGLSSKYGQTSNLGRADINGDGIVNYIDVSALASDYGR